MSSQLRQLSVLNRDCLAINNNSEVPTTKFDFYPNPSNDYIIIQTDFAKKFELFLYSIDGRLFKKYKTPKFIKLTNLANGMYLLRFKGVGEKGFIDEILIVE